MNWTVIREPTVLITSVVYGLLALLVSQAGIFGLWLGILLSFSVWRYCYTVLRAAAQGRSRFPAPDADSFNIVGEWGVFWHLVLFPGLFIAGLMYMPAGLIVAVIVAITFPASAALMGLSSNISHSVNPSAMYEIAKTLGSDYFVLVLGYLAVLIGGTIILSLLANVAGLLPLLLTFIVEFWMLFASFALIGAALRAHRLDFEIPGEVVPQEEKALAQRHEQWHKDLDIAYTAFRSGLNSSGYRTLHSLVAENGDTLEINHWLVENMLDWQEKKYALEVAAKLIPRLLAAARQTDALDLWLRCRRRDPAFRLPEPQARQLAEFARSVGHSGAADELGYNE